MNHSKPKNNKKALLIIVLLVIISLVLVFSTQKKSTKNIVSTVAKKGKISNTIRLNGTLLPEKEVEIKSRLSGILDHIYVEIGQKVKKGDPIARIRLIADPQSIEQAAKNLKMAEIQLNTERETFRRNTELFNSGVISKGDIDEIERVYLIKEAELESARHQMEIVQKGYKSGNKDISDLVLATLDGTILDIPLKEGASITERNNFNEGSTIAVLADLDHYNFHSQVSESEVALLKKGQTFSLQLNAIKNSYFNARWSIIHPKGIISDGIVKFPVQARLLTSSSKNFIKPGFTASANIELAKDSNVIVIEEALLNFRNDSTFVHLLDSTNTPKETYIKTGISDGVRIAIKEGIKTGDKIVNNTIVP